MSVDALWKGSLEPLEELLRSPGRHFMFILLGVRFLKVSKERRCLTVISEMLNGGAVDEINSWKAVAKAVQNLAENGAGSRQQMEEFAENIYVLCSQLDVSDGGVGCPSECQQSYKITFKYLLEKTLLQEDDKLRNIRSRKEGEHLWIIEEMDREIREWDLENRVEILLQAVEEDHRATVIRQLEDIIDVEKRVRENSWLLWGFKRIENYVLFVILGLADSHRSRLIFEMAILFGYFDVVKWLLLALQVLEDDFTIPERCLGFAIAKGFTDTLSFLLDSGSFDMKVNSQRYLNKALKTGQTSIVKALLDKGARLSDSNAFSTCLHDAVEADYLDCVQVLLRSDMGHATGINATRIAELAQLAAKEGHTNLYRFLMIEMRSKGFVREAQSAMSYKTELPFANGVVDYKLSSRTVTENSTKVGSTLDQRFLHTDEIAMLAGYGSVQAIPGDLFTKCATFVEKVIEESVVPDKITKHGLFPLSIMRCGSSGEGTKVGLPDEMDFQFRFEIDPHSLTIADSGHGFCSFLTKKAISTWHGLITVSSELFHDLFIGLAMTQKVHKNIIKSAERLIKAGGSATSEWTLLYSIDGSHRLDISVDRVPILYFKDVWPYEWIQRTWLMDRDTLKSEGFGLVPKPPSRLGIFSQCSLTESLQQRLFTVSFSHLETKHLACLDQRIKDVYITCKSLRDPDICRILFKDSKGLYLTMSKDLITSYMLKTVFMHNVEEFLHTDKSLVEMVYIVYTQLAKCIANWFVPVFWNPEWNLLEGLKHDPRECRQATKVMQSLATARFLRDGGTSTVVLETGVSDGGACQYIPGGGTAGQAHTPDVDIDGADSFDCVIYSRNVTNDLGYTVYQLGQA